MFKWEKGGVRPVEEDNEILMGNEHLHPKDDLVDLIREVNRKGCRPVYKDEPMYEEEHINKAVLTSRYYLDEFVQALINEGYKVMLEGTAKEDEVVITWKDKNDLMEEIKREARKIGEML